MGVNDAQEMLEAAQEECIRLEKELAELKAWKADAEERMSEAAESINLQIERGNNLALVEAKTASQRDAAHRVIRGARALADEHWDWKAGRVLAERLRFILSHADQTGTKP